jgi:hypothetical protein
MRKFAGLVDSGVGSLDEAAGSVSESDSKIGLSEKRCFSLLATNSWSSENVTFSDLMVREFSYGIY